MRARVNLMLAGLTLLTVCAGAHGADARGWTGRMRAPSAGTFIHFTRHIPVRFPSYVPSTKGPDDVLWTGATFLYALESYANVWDGGPTGGQRATIFAKVPNNGEMRCVLSSGKNGFAPGDIYCSAGEGGIYCICRGQVRLLTQLPPPPRATPPPHGTRPIVSDGALTFDTGGAFGGALLAVTGAGCGYTCGMPQGGALYTITAHGATRTIGAYGMPGGAENIAIAPADFGPYARDVLVTTALRNDRGRLLAIDRDGHVYTLMQDVPGGANSIVAIEDGPVPARGAIEPGLYLTDNLHKVIHVAPAAELRGYRGAVVVGTEMGRRLYLLMWHAAKLVIVAAGNDLPPGAVLEGATYIGG